MSEGFSIGLALLLMFALGWGLGIASLKHLLRRGGYLITKDSYGRYGTLYISNMQGPNDDQKELLVRRHERVI